VASQARPPHRSLTAPERAGQPNQFEKTAYGQIFAWQTLASPDNDRERLANPARMFNMVGKKLVGPL
jgi:hypothetical protein